MKVQRLGFTLIELLVVIAIIAVLAAVIAPVFMKARSAVKQSVAARAAGQTYISTTLYLADNDDTYPLGMYATGGGAWQTWFGLQTGENEWDTDSGLLGPYRGGKSLDDPTHFGLPYLGDGSGLGYNYGYIGSDMHITGNYSQFPNCQNAAVSSAIPNPSTTIVFGTSSFYNAMWLENGDGQTYDFGFISPVGLSAGNPTLDFRHFGGRQIVPGKQEVSSEGRAVVVFADGSTKPLTMQQLDDNWFKRDQNVE